MNEGCINMANEKLRGYRRGIPYRNGDIKQEDFLKEFKFKGIEYGEGYSENDKKRYLNYTYDALKDLSAILNAPSNVMSLLNKDNEKPNLYFGEANKGMTNLIVNKDGTVVRNWVYLLDKFLANQNKEVGLFNGLDNGEDSQPAHRLVNSLKFKEKVIDKSALTSEVLEGYRDAIYELIENMPFMQGADLDTVATVEDSRSRFIKELSDESLENMISVFEGHGLSLEGIKERLFELLGQAKVEYSSLLENNKNTDLVNTDFYLSAVERNKTTGLDKYTTNLELVVSAVEAYTYYKLKEISCYNNFLTNPNELAEISISNEENPNIYGSVERFFEEVMPTIIEAINIEDVEEAEVVQNIDKVLNDDKGKFKLTLFKKLAKEIGLKVDQSRSEKTDSGVYYIYFTEGYVKYIKPAVYNNPAETGHCINVYCGDSGDTKQGYWWDNELDYNDLVKFLVTLENEHRKEEKKPEVNKVDKDKFKLTEFKTACTKMNLTVDKSETPIVDKKYIIRFGNKSYIVYIAAPVYINTSVNKEQKIKIKTLREEVYHTWVGKLDYKELLLKLVEIEKQGKVALEEEKAEVQKQKAQVEQEKENMAREADKAKVAYKEMKLKEQKELESLLDCKDIESTKDLRDKMVKYIQMNRVSLGYPANFATVEQVVKGNVSAKDGAELIVERTVIADKNLQGNSKVWNKQGNRIQIQNRADNRKQLEGFIEAFVDMKLTSKNYSKVQKQMFRESLTFMICKVIGMDVRTYCNSSLFDRIVSSGSGNMSNYLRQTFKLFNGLISYFM